MDNHEINKQFILENLSIVLKDYLDRFGQHIGLDSCSKILNLENVAYGNVDYDLIYKARLFLWEFKNSPTNAKYYFIPRFESEDRIKILNESDKYFQDFKHNYEQNMVKFGDKLYTEQLPLIKEAAQC